MRLTLAREFQVSLKRAGIDRDGLGIHSQRYTVNSTLLAAGVPETVIRAWMGHVTSKMTDAFLIHSLTTGRVQARLLPYSELRTARSRLQPKHPELTLMVG
jgi:hypothetical protein